MPYFQIFCFCCIWIRCGSVIHRHTRLRPSCINPISPSPQYLNTPKPPQNKIKGTTFILKLTELKAPLELKNLTSYMDCPLWLQKYAPYFQIFCFCCNWIRCWSRLRRHPRFPSCLPKTRETQVSKLKKKTNKMSSASLKCHVYSYEIIYPVFSCHDK